MRMQVGFALEIKNQVGKRRRQLTNNRFKQFFFHHAGWPCKRAKAAWTFGASQITRSGWFDGNAQGKTMVIRMAPKFGSLKTGVNPGHVEQPLWRLFSNKIQAVCELATHPSKITFSKTICFIFGGIFSLFVVSCSLFVASSHEKNIFRCVTMLLPGGFLASFNAIRRR